MVYKLFYTCADKYTERNHPPHVYNRSSDVMITDNYSFIPIRALMPVRQNKD